MGKIMRGLVIGLLLALLAPPEAAADMENDETRCESNDLDISISGCTALINSGQMTRTDLSAAYTMRATSYERKSLYDQAIADSNKAIALDANGANYLVRGIAYLGKRFFDQAIADETKAIALVTVISEKAEAYEMRGAAFELKNQSDKAVADYRASLKLEPNRKNSLEGLKRLGVTP